MAAQFDHFLITRFNLRNPKWELTKNRETLLTDQWMTERLALFANFCLPSVAAQSNKDFRWLLFFDDTTAPAFRQQMAEMTAPHPFIEIHYIAGMAAFYDSIAQLVGRSEKPYLITSRLDNDDCIHRDFIAEVQQQFDRQDYLAIDVHKGYSLQVEPVMMLGKKEHVFNPFISLIEKNEQPRTVWANDHNHWKKESRVRPLTHRRLWMSIIHEKNKVNEFDGYGNVDWNDLRQQFIVSEAIDTRIQHTLLPVSKWRFLSFRNRLYVKWVMLNKLFKKSLGLYRVKK
ncbi:MULTISPECIES: glycosyltransferase [unclassified Flavobacterium]|uniref:glycosyltransferase n=1 Tax=unclassified Flavobacterium TaxID=196869 RepID=UPI001F13A57F|nr:MULTISPECIES: glycosyltransferase [unclassified Flavobacterium]UMY65467.1 putative rhamnosyl transferase [Flavobacterium sp. HJ-32-4]